MFVESRRESIYVTAALDFSQPCDPMLVRGAPKPFVPPSPDDLAVGAQGSTREKPIDLDASLVRSQKETITYVDGPQVSGSHVFRIDCPRPITLLRVTLPAGLSFVAARDRSLLDDLTVWSEHDHQVYAQSWAAWRRDAVRELIELNGEDGEHRGWPRDGGASHLQIFTTPWNTARRLIDPDYRGFPKCYSVRHLGQLEAPVNGQTALIESMRAQRHDTAAIATLIEAMNRQTAAIIAGQGKPTTFEPRESAAKK